MSKQNLTDCIKDSLIGDNQKNALELATYFVTAEIIAERETTGYWADKNYWNVSYQNKSVCNIAINENQDNSWYVTGDDSDSNWFENPPLDEFEKEVLRKCVAICSDCYGCGGIPNMASNKIIFGKNFYHVCPITLKFNNPDAKTISCMKKIFEIRKSDIQSSR